MFKEHDIQFVFGDLNFRIDLEDTIIKNHIKNNNYKELLTYDQFCKAKLVNSSLMEFEEGIINFDPTYKYDKGTNIYDTSKKKRSPAWCDRIFWKKTDDVEVISYNKVDYTDSDHKPVYGIYKIKTKKVLQKEKEKLINELKESLSLGLNISNKDFTSSVIHSITI